jgi:hypothetical protein
LAALSFRTGNRSNHPDDDKRLSAKYVQRDEAVAERDRRRKYDGRMVGYEVIAKHNFLRGWRCSRSVLRSRWMGNDAPYRTSILHVNNHSIYDSVREILPGEAVSSEDPFLQKFVDYVKMDGFMAFDTERKKPPVMVQVMMQYLYKEILLATMTLMISFY